MDDAAVGLAAGLVPGMDVCVEVAAGLEDGGLGTDATEVMEAIERADLLEVTELDLEVEGDTFAPDRSGWDVARIDPADGWTVAHQIAHLHWTDHVAALTAAGLRVRVVDGERLIDPADPVTLDGAAGVVLLGEALSTGLLVGFPLVIVGCWLAATGGRLRPRRPADGELPPIAAA